MAVQRLLTASLTLAALAMPATGSGAEAADAGEAIYRLGVTGSGPLEARRDGGQNARGAAAACVHCHQRSGLGGREGTVLVPPITGRYLYRPLPKDGGDRELPYVEGMRGDREPYTDELLARAIREGVDAEGRALSSLMPSYALDDADMAALIAYLKRLDQRSVPGVTDSTLHFATVITPDADPVKRAGMLDVMRQFFADRNVRQMVVAPAMQASGRAALGRSMFMVHRRWELHVWELTGPESSWPQQLRRRLAAEPVFAVISGLAGRSWAPVHAFCERAALPCLFPNVEAPPENADRDFYSMYFSRGVSLEAELIGARLLEAAGGAPSARVVQVYRAGDVGEAGAKRLAALLRARGVAASSRVVPAKAPASAVAEAARSAAGAGALVLWLRGQDLAALPPAPPRGPGVYLSGLMAGLERAPLPREWRPGAHMAYPFDLPERRRVRVDYALGWIGARRIPLVAEQVQVDTSLALGLVSETLKHMSDSFVREFLVERMESDLAHRIVTGYYPRLALSSRQRFASKGGYVVHFRDTGGTTLEPEGDWVAP
jgi:cytochrome c553